MSWSYSTLKKVVLYSCMQNSRVGLLLINSVEVYFFFKTKQIFFVALCHPLDSVSHKARLWHGA